MALLRCSVLTAPTSMGTGSLQPRRCIPCNQCSNSSPKHVFQLSDAPWFCHALERMSAPAG